MPRDLDPQEIIQILLMILSSTMTWMICASTSSISSSSGSSSVASSYSSPNHNKNLQHLQSKQTKVPVIVPPTTTEEEDNTNHDNFINSPQEIKEPRKREGEQASSKFFSVLTPTPPIQTGISTPFTPFIDRSLSSTTTNTSSFAGICFDQANEAHWSPTNCPDDTMWLRLWLEERRRIKDLPGEEKGVATVNPTSWNLVGKLFD